MKSSGGLYYIGLDHIRAIAAFVVFTWHFNHVNDGHLSPPPLFPFSLLTEGHTGVALFMVLSGYLFSKLLDGKKIVYASFLWNRILRLLPLLLVVIAIVGVHRYFTTGDIQNYAVSIISGVIYPTLPNGGWSITAEFHFYLMLPALLYFTKVWKYSLLIALVVAITIRYIVHQELGQIQTLSYWTIVGRVDQFLLGILAHQFRRKITGKHLVVLLSFIAFSIFYWFFDFKGGFFKNPSYPSPNSIWIYLPLIEGLFYALVVAWYDSSFVHSTGRISRLIALVGTYSYSIYLLHFFIVFRLSQTINTYVLDLSNVYVVIIISFFCFLLMVPIGYLSYRFIESPFLKFRKKYTISRKIVNP